MVTTLTKKISLCIFCLASITQGMYSTYFVSILTTIERMYQIQSKTAGAILSATEIGQILGSLLIAHYGGRGNKPKWISACMALSAIAALASITPHFMLFNHARIDQSNVASSPTPMQDNQFISASSPYSTSDLAISELTTTSSIISPIMSVRNLVEVPDFNNLCLYGNSTTTNSILKSVNYIENFDSGTKIPMNLPEQQSYGLVLVIFFICLLAIGFGSTAITTLGIPFIDDIVSKEESPMYLGLTIGLKIFGPALGFLLGSFCINLNLDLNTFNDIFVHDAQLNDSIAPKGNAQTVGAWWLGLILISLPLLILALPMYILSRMIECNDNQNDDFADITYQAAEDHDIGGSHDFQSHILGLDGIGESDLADLASNRTCFSSEMDSSSREVLQVSVNNDIPSKRQYHQYSNYGRNISLEQPILATSDDINKTKLAGVGSLYSHLTMEENAEQKEQPIAPLSSTMEVGTVRNDFVDNATSNWRSGICVVVNHFGRLEPTDFTNDEIRSLHECSPQTSSRSSIVPTSPAYPNKATRDHHHHHHHQQQQQQQQQLQQSTITDLTSTLSRLIKNRLLLLRMLSGILHILPIAGFYTFFPKYLIEQFRITSSSASAISGLAGILFVGLGAFIGGTVVRVFNVNSRLMTRWIATSALLYMLGMLVLMNLGCPKNQTVHYNSLNYVSTDCLTTCKCLDRIYNPVCANGTTYLSPCLAGCRNFTISGDRIFYDECGCSSSSLVSNLNTESIISNSTLPNLKSISETVDLKSPKLQNDHINLNVATQGHCLIECDNLKWYIIVFSISTLIHASCEVGSMMFNLRCVKSGDRALALGLTTFSSSLLGTIPCSVIYGTVVDYTCIHWSTIQPAGLGGGGPSQAHGACQSYENDSFRYYLHSITAFVMFLAFLVDCLISRRSSEVDFYDGNDSRTDIRMELKKSTETI